MNSLVPFFLLPATGPGAIFFLRLAVGLIFSTQGILRFSDPSMGVLRFARMGFAHPVFTAHFCRPLRNFLRRRGPLDARRIHSPADHHFDRYGLDQIARTLAPQSGTWSATLERILQCLLVDF
jgi:hypothetical protein